jgi:hypothetical protein
MISETRPRPCALYGGTKKLAWLLFAVAWKMECEEKGKTVLRDADVVAFSNQAHAAACEGGWWK